MYLIVQKKKILIWSENLRRYLNILVRKSLELEKQMV